MRYCLRAHHTVQRVGLTFIRRPAPLAAGRAPIGKAICYDNFLLAILPILLYQILAPLGERELGEQYGQQGEA